MRWSKLKQLVEANFAESVRSRLAIHSTAYGNCTCGHAWLTLDGEVIANFCTRAYFNRFQYGLKELDAGLTDEQVKRYADQSVEYGEISRQDVYEVCWEFVHDISIDDAMQRDDPLIQSLMVLDKRVGKRRLAKLEPDALHPLAAKLMQTRLLAETNRHS